ncbi:cupin domain-containing protein [Nonomuraea sp. NPDC049684]|uniref:cupin domain-containing protein n=1 Tax=unclassified Nonomuraea TaxID=2593643 RepID=UPI0037895047
MTTDERDGPDVTPATDWLLGPVSREEFLRDHQGRRHLLLRRRSPGHYRELFSLARFDELLSGSGLHAGAVRVVRDGHAGGGAAGLEDLYARYRDGSTLIMPAVHERWPPLRRLCRRLAGEFSAECRVNAYLTPPRARGFGVHRDSHDVFVLQVSGAKRWRIHDDAPHEFDLCEGDLLYLPRGLPHEAASAQAASLHLSIGVHPLTWADVLLAGCEAAVSADPAFQEPLPVGFARTSGGRAAARERAGELAARLAAALTPDRLADDAVDMALLAEGDRLDGHLLDLAGLAQLDAGTAVRRRPGLRWESRRDAGTLVLAFHGKRLSLPARHEAAVLRMADGEPFTAAGLPGTDGLALVRRLVQEGFLTLATSG